MGWLVHNFLKLGVISCPFSMLVTWKIRPGQDNFLAWMASVIFFFLSQNHLLSCFLLNPVSVIKSLKSSSSHFPSQRWKQLSNYFICSLVFLPLLAANCKSLLLVFEDLQIFLDLTCIRLDLLVLWLLSMSKVSSSSEMVS